MATATELCNQGNEQYVSEDYQKAVELYTSALALDDKRDDIYCHRAQAYLQLGKLSEAAADCDKALELNENNNKAYIKKGSALFQMDEIGKALDVFKEGQKRFASDCVLQDWVQRCETKLPKSGTENKTNDTVQPADCQAAAGPPKIKHDWYQTHTHVIVTVLVKNVKKENLKVNVEDRSLDVNIVDASGATLTLNLTLAHQVDPSQTATKIYGTKVEIKLKKKEGIQWAKLEGSPEQEEKEILPSAAAPVPEEPPRYPSSSHYTRDWDKLAAEVAEEEKNEKLEGDAALNQFFQKIYADASDDTKKAMMKSFSESGGTVLSTNWDEVGSKKVDVKPPDGMEFKKWEH